MASMLKMEYVWDVSQLVQNVNHQQVAPNAYLAII